MAYVLGEGALLLLLLMGAGNAGAATPENAMLKASAAKPAPVVFTAEEKTKLAQRLGIKIESMYITAGGYMLHFRYRVLDPAKAQPLLDRRTHPYLELTDSKTQLGVAEANNMGSLRNTTRFPKANRIYYALFANPGQRVKAGDKVDVVFGKYRLDGVEVHDGVTRR